MIREGKRRKRQQRERQEEERKKRTKKRAKILVAMRKGETPVPIPNTTVKP